MAFNNRKTKTTPTATTAVTSRKTTPAGVGPIVVRGSHLAMPPGQAERLDRASPFRNGYVESLWPKTLVEREDGHSGTVTSEGGQESVVALPCLHWADSDGICRFTCRDFKRAWPNLVEDGED